MYENPRLHFHKNSEPSPTHTSAQPLYMTHTALRSVFSAQ